MSDFAPYDFLKESVDEGDAFKVRLALAGIIMADPTFRISGDELDRSIEYAQVHGIQVFESEFDPHFEIKTDRTQWTPEYFVKALTYLKANFTRERLEHVKEVAVYTHPQKPKPSQQQPKLTQQQMNPCYPSHGGNPSKKAKSRQRKLLVGVAVAALVILVMLVVQAIKK